LRVETLDLDPPVVCVLGVKNEHAETHGQTAGGSET
jgi:hypothetical protein